MTRSLAILGATVGRDPGARRRRTSSRRVRPGHPQRVANLDDLARSHERTTLARGRPDADAARSISRACPGHRSPRGHEGLEERQATLRSCNAIVGFAGVPRPWPLCARAGTRPRHKESLIVAADLVEPVRSTLCDALPVDSEHCAVHQCSRGSRGPTDAVGPAHRAHRLGRPVRGRGAEELEHVTVATRWRTRPGRWAQDQVDCSTLMNRGRGLEPRTVRRDVALVDVVVHPSRSCTRVELVDGSTLAQLNLPNAPPIAYALGFPTPSTTGSAGST